MRTRTRSTPQQERARLQPPPQKMSQWRTTKPNEHPVWPRTNILFLLCFVFPLCCGNSDSELVEPPSPCESCVLLARELQLKSQRIHKKSEAEFIDLSETICKTMLDYKVHKEVSGISRFAREDSQTMKTLKQLKDRGVKVELGMPYEMWDQPAAEVSLLRQHCDLILAEYEDDLSEWFTAGAAQNLEGFLCLSRYLKGKDSSCLHSPAVSEKQDL